ncbi:EAL domain-containing protein [Clostridium malenominatum]|uniref:EAL domain-containing protein n=1 Tax=Clostridium malenominatum TaxID=1539 RepID=A0ABP3TTL4_9CLOT
MNNFFHELENILINEAISTVFQPIVSLKDGSILGYEALSRGPKDSPLNSPDKLFSCAKEYNKLWEIEKLCRVKAIERSSKINKNTYLFLNVDPHTLKDEKFIKGFTKEFLRKHDISPNIIIFEITEKTSIDDYKSFKHALNNYVEQGFKIAIDDTGAGYSGLRTIAETKPNYIKIDMDIVRNVHVDSFKRSLIKSLVCLCEDTNIKLIAEGIENMHELKELIELGVFAGQGYFIEKPREGFQDIDAQIKNLISKLFREKKTYSDYHKRNIIGDISSYYPPFNTDTSCGFLKKHLEENIVFGACIISNNKPIGLIMKHSLDAILSTQYGVSVFSKRAVTSVMDRNPLIVDYYTSIYEVCDMAMNREENNIYDKVIITKDGCYYGMVTIKNLLQHTTYLKTNYCRQLNPLTGLPGNSLIEDYLNDIINTKENNCVLYFDLDNFKIYNDIYGFEHGDKVIKFTSTLIENTTQNLFPLSSFIGHIGGDDFVVIIKDCTHIQCEDLCNIIIQEFDMGIKDFFNKEHLNMGYIEGLNRKGVLENYKLTSISIAGIWGKTYTYSYIYDLSKDISALKSKCKLATYSSFLINEV